jgi:transposase
MGRRKYSDEYKREAVALTREPGATQAQVARDLGISPNMLGKWVREVRESGERAFPGKGQPRDEELASLKRELNRVRKERDFLRDAATFYAKHPN